MAETRKVSDIVWREDLYPRINPDPATIQQYADNLDLLPPIEVNQHNEIIDGYHRWTAHRKVNAETIPVTITETANEAEFLRLAIQRNAIHGLQLSADDKRSMARKLFSANGTSKEEIAGILSVSSRSIANWVQDIERAKKDERNNKIFEMWMGCYGHEEISYRVGLSQPQIVELIKDLSVLERFQKSINLSATYQNTDWQPQLYDIWNFSKNSNSTKHYGNTAVEIVDNLLYAFTEPFDIVVDPFGGGGSTIDVCKKRLRRYWVSDRKPVVERPDIRQHDLTQGVSGPYHWGDVSLVYLDPPYWKQAAGKYSNDPTDLANMSLDEFTTTLIGIIEGYGEKIKPGAHIACIISPTQWPNEDKSTNYHDIDLACRVRKNLKLVRRVLCPYSTEQYNGTQVEIAKKDKLWLVLTRTLLVFERM